MGRSRNLLGSGLCTRSCDPDENFGASGCALLYAGPAELTGPRGCVTFPSLKLNSAP